MAIGTPPYRPSQAPRGPFSEPAYQHTTIKWSGPSGRDVAQRGCEVHKVTRLQLRRVGGSATIEELDRDDTGDGLAPRLQSH